MNITIWLSIGFWVVVSLYAFRKWNLRPVHWDPKEVSALLLSWIDNNVDDRSWDYFESCEIANPKLEEVRQRALNAISFNSPFITAEREDGLRLNAQGIELFQELIKKCVDASI